VVRKAAGRRVAEVEVEAEAVRVVHRGPRRGRGPRR
jgi:hypothetical protein